LAVFDEPPAMGVELTAEVKMILHAAPEALVFDGLASGRPGRAGREPRVGSHPSRRTGWVDAWRADESVEVVAPERRSGRFDVLVGTRMFFDHTSARLHWSRA